MFNSQPQCVKMSKVFISPARSPIYLEPPKVIPKLVINLWTTKNHLFQPRGEGGGHILPSSKKMKVQNTQLF